jgi:hypothetical protein
MNVTPVDLCHLHTLAGYSFFSLFFATWNVVHLSLVFHPQTHARPLVVNLTPTRPTPTL